MKKVLNRIENYKLILFLDNSPEVKTKKVKTEEKKKKKKKNKKKAKEKDDGNGLFKADVNLKYQ